MIIKQQEQTIQQQQPFRHTQCLNSFTCFYSLLQVDYICGVMWGIVNEGIGISNTAQVCCTCHEKGSQNILITPEYRTVTIVSFTCD